MAKITNAELDDFEQQATENPWPEVLRLIGEVRQLRGAAGGVLLQWDSLQQFGPSHDGSVERDLATAMERLREKKDG